MSRRGFSSYSSQNVLTKRNQRCQQQEVTAIKTPTEFRLLWRRYFPNTPVSFRIYADFEVDKETDNSWIEKITTKISHRSRY